MNNDLISRSALCEKLQANKDFFVNAWGGFGNLPPKDKARVDEITHCIAETMNAPSVDAVIPVRCKDCKRMFVPVPGIRYCTVWNNPNGMGDDGFCNYGERRTE